MLKTMNVFIMQFSHLHILGSLLVRIFLVPSGSDQTPSICFPFDVTFGQTTGNVIVLCDVKQKDTGERLSLYKVKERILMDQIPSYCPSICYVSPVHPISLYFPPA